jgi:acylphosphatase
MEPDGEVEAHVTVTGRVQGVYYRQSLVHVAAGHGVRGWVRNRPDGSVEAVLQGRRPSVDAVIAWMRRGPPGAMVADAHVASTEPAERYDGFAIRG